MNTINNIFDKIKSFVTENKKVSIIAGVFLLVIIGVKIYGSVNKGPVDNIATKLTEIHNGVNYSATGSLSVGGTRVDIEVNKSGGDFNSSISVPDSETDARNLLSKKSNVIYLNECYKEKGGLITIKKVTAEGSVDLLPFIYTTIGNSAQELCSKSGNEYKLEALNAQDCQKIFKSLSEAIEANKTNILAGYETSAAVTPFIDTLIRNFKINAESSVNSESISVSLKLPDEEQPAYVLSFNVVLDKNCLPSFIDLNYFDANQLNIEGTVNFVPSEANLEVPTGSIRNCTGPDISEFIANTWKYMFTAVDYVTFNDVTITKSTVTNVNHLGDTTETAQFVFDSEGLSNAMWIISSHNKDIINNYFQRYGKNSGLKEDDIIHEENTNTYSLTLEASEDAIQSLSYFATNPQDFGNYLKTAKGVDIIV